MPSSTLVGNQLGIEVHKLAETSITVSQCIRCTYTHAWAPRIRYARGVVLCRRLNRICTHSVRAACKQFKDFVSKDYSWGNVARATWRRWKVRTFLFYAGCWTIVLGTRFKLVRCETSILRCVLAPKTYGDARCSPDILFFLFCNCAASRLRPQFSETIEELAWHVGQNACTQTCFDLPSSWMPRSSTCVTCLG